MLFQSPNTMLFVSAVQMVLALQLIAGAGKLAVSDVERDNVANRKLQMTCQIKLKNPVYTSA